MNPYETNNQGARDNSAPLFASVWLALFKSLRENYQERHLAATVDTDPTRMTDDSSSTRTYSA